LLSAKSCQSVGASSKSPERPYAPTFLVEVFSETQLSVHIMLGSSAFLGLVHLAKRRHRNAFDEQPQRERHLEYEHW
jgi:hypothetical protein